MSRPKILDYRYVRGGPTPEQGQKAENALQSIGAGTNITVDNTDPQNPVISSTSGGGGSGNVIGPASSVDNGVALFSGTSGKVIKDGGVLTKSSVGLSNVDNTSDVNKPVSTAQAASDALRVLKSGDTMTGDLRFSGAGLRIAGDFSGTPANRLFFTTTTVNGACNVGFAPNGTGSVALLSAFSSSDVANASAIQVRSEPGYALLNSINTGTGAVGVWMWQFNSVTALTLDTSENLYPGHDNASTLGKPASRWSVVYAATGSINTSDAREKTAVDPLTAAELAAAADLSRAIGTYQWLAMVAEKGADGARHHAGLTVQRAIEIMQSHGLDPMRYGFICHDEWDETPEVRSGDTGEITQAYHPSGDRYSFRTDELLLFMARGFAARLDALEAKA